MRAGQDLFVVIQVLGHSDQMVLDIGEIQALCSCQQPRFRALRQDPRCRIWERRAIARYLYPISTITPGSRGKESSHRLARPLTTSALLPINRSRPMTFFRHVPILQRIQLRKHAERRGATDRLNMSLCSASFNIKTNSSILSTSYSILWINGPKASVMSSMRA